MIPQTERKDTLPVVVAIRAPGDLIIGVVQTESRDTEFHLSSETFIYRDQYSAIGEARVANVPQMYACMVVRDFALRPQGKQC